MRYYNEIGSKDKEMAYMAVAIYLIVLIAAVIFVKFSLSNKILKTVPQQAILITFGEMGDATKLGSRTSGMVNADKGSPDSAEVPNFEQALDNDYAEDAVIHNLEKKKEDGINARALYKANKGSQTPSSNKKKIAGSSESNVNSHESSDNRVSLSGRYIVGNLPYPNYASNSQGSVVIEIHVNQLGEVTHAAFVTRGSTTNDSILIAEALKAARKAIFNVDRQSSVMQSGTITYVFNLR